MLRTCLMHTSPKSVIFQEVQTGSLQVRLCGVAFELVDIEALKRCISDLNYWCFSSHVQKNKIYILISTVICTIGIIKINMDDNCITIL